MQIICRRAVGILLPVLFFGWLTYPGWFNTWYSNAPEGYAHPASMSNAHDPHWGFWYW
jgi:hypothetical protein